MPIPIFDWLEAWLVLWCDEDWEHQYGVVLQSAGTAGWTLEADVKDTAFDGEDWPRSAQHRSPEDWVEWELTGDKFRARGGVWNLCEMLEVFRECVQTSPPQIQRSESVTRFLASLPQDGSTPRATALEWLEKWYRDALSAENLGPTVKLETLDNPGWHLRICGDQPILPHSSSSFSIKRSQHDWLDWHSDQKTFDANAGVRNLTEAVEAVRREIDESIRPEAS